MDYTLVSWYSLFVLSISFGISWTRLWCFKLIKDEMGPEMSCCAKLSQILVYVELIKHGEGGKQEKARGWGSWNLEDEEWDCFFFAGNSGLDSWKFRLHIVLLRMKIYHLF